MTRKLGPICVVAALVAGGLATGSAPAAAKGRDPIWTAAIAHSQAKWVGASDLAVDPFGRREFALLTIDNPGTSVYGTPAVVALDTSTGHALWRWTSSTDLVHAMELGPGGRQLYLASTTRSGVLSRVTVLRASTGKVLWRAERDGKGWWAIAVAPDGHTVYVAGVRPRTQSHRQVRTVIAAYRAGSGALRWAMPVATDAYGSEPGTLAVTRSGTGVIASIGVSDSKSQLCPNVAAALLRASDGGVRWITQLAPMPGCGSLLQVDSAQGIVVLPWSARSHGSRINLAGIRLSDGKELWRRQDKGRGSVSGISATGRVAVSTKTGITGPSRLILCRLTTGKTVWSIAQPTGTLEFSPNGGRLYVGAGVPRSGGSGVAVLWARSAASGGMLWRSARYEGPLVPTGTEHAWSDWTHVVVGAQGNRIFVAGSNSVSSGEESSRTIPIFGAFRS